MKLSEFKKISPVLYRDLRELFEEHDIKMGHISVLVGEEYGTFKFTIEASDVNLKTADGSPTTPEAKRFIQEAKWLGLKPEDLGRTITIKNVAYTIAGLRESRRAKKRVILKLHDQQYFIETRWVAEQLRNQDLAQNANP